MNETKIKVSGMNCNHCKISVETGLKRIAGIESVLADITSNEVKIKGNRIDIGQVKTVIENLGYSYFGDIK